MADGVQPELVPSQPPDPYVRQFDFTNHEQTQPNKPVPGSKIDLELNEVRESLNDTIDRLNEIQADDGSLRPGNISSQLDQKVAAAESARNDSVAAKVEAVAAKDQVLIAQGAVIGIANNQIQVAQGYVEDASLAAINAQTSAGEAFGHMQTAENAKILAELARDNAQASAVTANDKRLLAESAANTAQSHAANAYSQAQQAAQSAFNAAQSADLAGTSELDAASHALAAAESAADAAQSAAEAAATTYAAPLSKTGNQVSIDPAYKPNPFDQELNTTNVPTFDSVVVTGGFDLLGGGVTFADATLQTTAAVNTPDATTTVAGKVELATILEAHTGSSGTLAVTPDDLAFRIHSGSTLYLTATDSDAIVSGGTTATSSQGLHTRCGTASGSYGMRVFTGGTSNGFAASVGGGSSVSFSKRMIFSGKCAVNSSTDAGNYAQRVQFGKTQTGTAIGNLNAKGVGIRATGAGNALDLLVHNGTTLTAVASSFTPLASQAFDWQIHSDGSGNVTLYVNGSSVATSSAGPTGASGSLPCVSVETEATAAVASVVSSGLQVSNLRVSFDL